MRKKILVRLIVFCFLLNFTANSQNVDPKYLYKQWGASWISVPKASANGYGVYLFRKSVELKEIPKSFTILVSADNCYKLYVNGKLVSTGPARGDVSHWNYETVDLVNYLQAGKNVIATIVWNEGDNRPTANVSLRTAFILQGGSSTSQALNTDNTWKCKLDDSYQALEVNLPMTAYRAGVGEFIDNTKRDENWREQEYDDSNWQKAIKVGPGLPTDKVGFGDANGWKLIPSPLPPMEMKTERIPKCVVADGIKIPTGFPAQKTVITIPTHSQVTLLLDNTQLTNAYPTLQFSGGKNAKLSLGYAETLYSTLSNPWIKNNRNEFKGKIFKGRTDSILSNGKENQEFTSLTWRTYRYLQLKVYTEDTPLTINDLYATFTGYPFTLEAKVETDNTEIKKILKIGWRTARLCAVDTYMDCPYYEQLQYIGDTRIQAMISLYNSGDDRLIKNALNQFEYSQQVEGVTQSRYPSNSMQFITPFSLWYIGMVHDYMMYGNDSLFVQSKLSSVRRVVDYFKKFQQPDGSVKNLPWWNFSDWVNTERWFLGVRVADGNGNSSLVDLQLLWAYQLAADLEMKLGLKEMGEMYQKSAAKLQNTIKNKYWDNVKNVFADNADKDLFSQHANTFAILTNTVTGNEAITIGKKLLNDTTLAPASIYFKYYLHQALTKTGFGNEYLSWLGKWRENIALGLTTWAETSDIEKSRSDCHAWGASPNIEIFRTILGIDSDAPGFSKVRIEPHLGTIKNISGEIPHPNGKIGVKYSVKAEHITAIIILPKATMGQFIWKGKSYPLIEGENTIKI